MPAPSLRIPLGLNMQEFDKNIESAKSSTASLTDFAVKQFAKAQLRLVVNSDGFKPSVQAATKFIGDEFQKVKPLIQGATQTIVKETAEAGLKATAVLGAPAIKGSFQAFTAVGVPAAAGLAQALIPLALRAFAVYEAIHLVAEAIGAARNQITEMVAVADKASNMTVSPQFLQLFEGESRKLKVTVEDLDGALKSAFTATKEKSPIDLEKWEAGKERITAVELALRVYNDQLAKVAGSQLKGLVLFRDAQSQDDKIKAVLTSMVELDKLGQHTASLDLGEKMFGVPFVDKIRQGKTSAEGILETMEKLKASGDGIFPDAIVQRAKAVDEQLQLSQDRLSRAMKPSWDQLASVILSIKSTWADVVDLIAKGVEYANMLGTGIQRWELNRKKQELNDVNEALKSGTGIGGIPRIPGADAVRSFLGQSSVDDDLRKRAYRLQGEIDSKERELRNTSEGPDAPKVSRGTGDAPTLKKKESEVRDPFDVAVDNVTKHIATLNADTAATFQNAAAQAQFRAEFQELTALMRADGEVTQKQIDLYEKYRQSMSATEALTKAGIVLTKEHREAFLSSSEGIKTATAAYGAAQDKLQKLNSASQQVGSALSTAFSDAIIDGKKFGDVLSSLIKTLEKAALNSLFAQFFNAPSTGGLSPALAFLGIGKNAEGTDNWSGGPTWVGEKGPEIINAPRGSQIIPNAVVARSGGGNNSFAVTVSLAGANGDAAIRQMVAQGTAHGARAVLNQVPGLAVRAVDEHLRRVG